MTVEDPFGAMKSERSNELFWTLLAFLLTTISTVLLFFLDKGFGLLFFFFLLASIVSIGEADRRSPKAVADRNAIKLDTVLERQIRDWNTIIDELRRLRQDLATGTVEGHVSRWDSHFRLLDECNALLRDAQLELRDARIRLKAHREVFNTAYWIHQSLDPRGRPNYKYIIHRGLCASCNNGRRKSHLSTKKWDGPYEEWEHAGGIGTRRFCISCCGELRVAEYLRRHES